MAAWAVVVIADFLHFDWLLWMVLFCSWVLIGCGFVGDFWLAYKKTKWFDWLSIVYIKHDCFFLFQICAHQLMSKLKYSTSKYIQSRNLSKCLAQDWICWLLSGQKQRLLQCLMIFGNMATTGFWKSFQIWQKKVLWWMENQLTNGWITSLWKQKIDGGGQQIELGKPCLANHFTELK